MTQALNLSSPSRSSTEDTPRVAHGLDRVVGWFSFAMSLLGTVGIGAIGALTVADIVGRNLFDHPIVGTIEIAKTSIVAIAFLTLPYAMRRGSHVRSTVLLSRLAPKPFLAMTSLSCILGAVLFALIAYASWEPMRFAIESGSFEGEGALRVPTWPTRVVIVVGSVVMAVECLLTLITRRGYSAGDVV